MSSSTDENIEAVSMTIIAHSGEARTNAFQALEEAKKGNTQQAKQLLEQSKEAILRAHKAQTELLVKEAQGEKPEINVLLIHSQDHLMTSMLAQELIEEIVYLHNTKEDKS